MLRETLIANNVLQMAHDIRSPLFALQTVLEAPGEFDEKKRNLLKMATQRLQEIADSILAENKKSDETNLNELIQEIVTEKTASFPQFKFDYSTSNENAFCKLNSVEMKRIISNLINNSIEAYEGTQGEIKVSLVKADGVTSVTVKDNGKGIPLSLIPHIIGKSHGKTNGNGLGLSHAKEYIESIGGQILITSAPAQGTEICLSF